MDYTTAAFIGAGCGIVALWIYATWVWMLADKGRESPPDNQPSDIERNFRAVFSIMSEDRRQSLIRYNMEQYECDRLAAMKRAVDDRERDARRWV